MMTFRENGKVGIGTSIPSQTLEVNGRLQVTQGVIQNGSPAITTTSDLGLYSLEPQLHMRFVTNNAPFRFFSDGGTTPEGGTELLSIEPAGNLRLNEHDIYFRSGFPNGNHGIGWYGDDPNFPPAKLFAQTNVNGPVVYGYDGGALGSKQSAAETIALRWDGAGNVVIGDISATGPPKLFTNGGIVSTTNRVANCDYNIKIEVNRDKTKALSVIKSGSENFLVFGNGFVFARRFEVATGTFTCPDYVFKKGYPLRTIEQLNTFIDSAGHHPNFLSAKEYEKKGKYDLLEMDMNLLKTSEELTRYAILQNEKDKQKEEKIINLQKKVEEQDKKMDEQGKIIEQLEKRIKQLEKK